MRDGIEKGDGQYQLRRDQSECDGERDSRPDCGRDEAAIPTKRRKSDDGPSEHDERKRICIRDDEGRAAVRPQMTRQPVEKQSGNLAERGKVYMGAAVN